MEKGFLRTGKKEECLGCEACIQVCHKGAIAMVEDNEGFRYPKIDIKLCVDCGCCNAVCPIEHAIDKSTEQQFTFGGYNLDSEIREQSTSGGVFSAIVDSWCDENYVIFGAKSSGLEVYHDYCTDKRNLEMFRRSKYSQSCIGNSYQQVRKFLKEGKKVLFSGTPCHIAGLKSYLRHTDCTRLLTVEVVCEGVPSPFFIRKYAGWALKKYGCSIKALDYRYKDGKRWDFEVMRTILSNKKILKKDRWFNPFWSIWLQHLMSRPSCYKCPFATTDRVADLTLGDLWGVHIYCPELYGKNGGSSLVICNTLKGKTAFENTRHMLYGHELDLQDALKYQGPMRKTISMNKHRTEFMQELADSETKYTDICKKWAVKPSWKLLWQKYVWGNRQKVFLWNLKNK